MTWKLAEEAHIILKEEPVYPLFAFISDIGGAAGLFLGLSVIKIIRVIFDFIGFLVNKLARLFFEKCDKMDSSDEFNELPIGLRIREFFI